MVTSEMNLEGCIELLGAIIKTAIKDYQLGLKKTFLQETKSWKTAEKYLFHKDGLEAQLERAELDNINLKIIRTRAKGE